MHKEKSSSFTIYESITKNGSFGENNKRYKAVSKLNKCKQKRQIKPLTIVMRFPHIKHFLSVSAAPQIQSEVD